MAEEDVGGYYSVLRLKIDENSFKRGQQKAKEYSQTINQTLNDKRTYNQFNYTVNNYNRQARENAQRITSASASYASAYRSLGESLRAFSNGNLMGGASSFARFAEQLGRVKQAQNQKTTYTTNAKGEIVPIAQAGAGGGGAAGAGGMKGLLGGAAGGAIAVAAVAAVAVIVAGVMGKKIVDMAAKETVETTAAKYSNLSIGSYSALNAVGTASGVGRNALQGSMAALDQKYQAIKTGNVDTEMIKSIAMLGVSFHRTRYMDSAQRYTTIMNAALRMRDERLAGLLVGNVLGEAGAKQFYFTKQTGIGFGQQMSDARRSVYTNAYSKSGAARASYSGGMLGSTFASMGAYGGSQLANGIQPLLSSMFGFFTNPVVKDRIQAIFRAIGDGLRMVTAPIKLVFDALNFGFTLMGKIESGAKRLFSSGPLFAFAKQIALIKLDLMDIWDYFFAPKGTRTVFGETIDALGKKLHELFGWVIDGFKQMFDPDVNRRQQEYAKFLTSNASTVAAWKTLSQPRGLAFAPGQQALAITKEQASNINSIPTSKEDKERIKKLVGALQLALFSTATENVSKQVSTIYGQTGDLAKVREAVKPQMQDIIENLLQQSQLITTGTLTSGMSKEAILAALGRLPKSILDYGDLEGTQNINYRVNGIGSAQTITVVIPGLAQFTLKQDATGKYSTSDVTYAPTTK